MLFTAYANTASRRMLKGSVLCTKRLFAGKLLIMLLFAATMQAGATGYGQNVSLSVNDAPLERALISIKEQTGYHLAYLKEWMRTTKKVTLQLKNVPFTAALDTCFKDQPLTYTIIEKTIVVKPRPAPEVSTQPTSDPPVKVTGRVIDSAGNPIVRASVIVKGTNMGTATREDGSFSLESPQNSGTIVVSYVGYKKQEIAFSGNANLTVKLLVLGNYAEEVIIQVGYGTQSKINLSGAVDQIKATQIQNRPVPNISSALQGLAANLNVFTTSAGGQPDATKSINIRGYTGFNSLAPPLILVDGVPADINSVNPNDVETISILKDIASTAIYGSRAPNGVILITTKHGKKNSAPQVSYSNNLSWTNPINLPKTMNSYDFANLYNEASENSGTGVVFTQNRIQNILQYMKDPNSVQVVQTGGDSSNWNSYGTGVANNDWYSLFMKRNVFNQQHNLSVDGGNEKTTYFFSLGELDQNANLNFFKGYTYSRYNLRANISTNVTKWMTIGLENSFARTNDKVPYSGDIGYNWFYDVPRQWPVLPLYAPNGGLTDATQASHMASGNRYTAFQANDSWIKGNVEIRPLAGLDIHGDYAYNYYARDNMDYRGVYYHSTPRNPNTLGYLGVPSIQKTANFNHYHSYNIYGSYEKRWRDHYFKVLIGQQEEYQYYSSFYAYNTNLYDPNLPSLSLTYGNPSSVGDGGGAWATFGTFGRFNYNYNGKYIVEFNGRYMGTSLFPANTRYHFFKSVSGAWNVSREGFFEPLLNTVKGLKFRVSYGGTGDISYFLNQNPPNYYPYLSNLGTNTPGNTSWIFGGPNSDTRQPAITPPGLVSPTLTWAKPSMLDVGVDIDLLNDYNIVFDWYRKKISAQFGPGAVVPSTLGTSAPRENNATSVTTGFDLTINWRHVYGKVGLFARGTLSNYVGKVLSYTGNKINSLSDWYNGQTFGTIWGYKTVGKFQSQAQITSSPKQTFIAQTWYPGDIQYADMNHDGKVDNGNNTLGNHGDLTIIGNNSPRYQYGLTLGANLYGFDLSVFMQGVGGGHYFPQTNVFWGIYGVDMYHAPALKTLYDRWTPANPNGYFPRATFYTTQDRQIQSGYLLSLAYWRLKNLSLGYTFAQSLMSRLNVSRLRLYLSIDNLLTIAPGLKHSYTDPEELLAGEQIYPLMRAVSIGAQVSFR